MSNHFFLSAALRNRALLSMLLCLALAGLAHAATPWPNLPATPIAIQAQADPNIVLTIDDSGSMAWAYVPDTLYGSLGSTNRFLSWRINPLAYNPFIVYDLPYKATLDGTTLTTSFTAAYINGYGPSISGCTTTVNLSSNYQPVYSYTPSGCTQSVIGTQQAAYIYAYYGDLGPGNVLPNPGDDPNAFVYNSIPPVGTCASLAVAARPGNDACYVKIVIPAGHKQNFANWYSFYKTRNLMIKTSANLALFDVNPNYRFAWQAINTCNSGFNNGTCQNYFRPLSNTTNKQTFYAWLAKLPASGGTPMQGAMQRAGQFFQSTGVSSPRAYDPGVAENPVSTCRANFHMLMTDGLWNGAIVSSGNVDGSGASFPDGTTYSAKPPYKDSYSSTLADLAFNYWKTDLDGSTNNELVPYYVSGSTDYWDPRNDPATWQHMVNFTVGIGLDGYLTGAPDANNGNQYMPKWGGNTYAGDYPSLVSGSVAWPQAGLNFNGSGNDANVADLWHAAINSRGQFFNATDPSSVRSAFASVLNRIKANATSLGQIASSTTRVTGSTVSVDSKFVPADWYATLTAYTLNTDGSRGAALWTSDATFTSSSGRNIVTYAAGSGTTFDASFLSSYGSSLLGVTNPDIFNWIRGDRSKEGMVAGSITLRKRKQLLGDIIGSDLLISGKTDQGYAFIADVVSGDSAAARAAYPNYVGSKTRSVVFVGANDGMVHAFDANNGQEVFAYIPSAVLGRLKDLADSNYVHEYFVDGSLALYDAYLSGGWHTILIGGLGSGGRGWFALDVTSVITGGGFAPTDVVFDIKNTPSDSTLRELGYSFPMPVITRTIKGNWVALLGNGYGDNSSPYTTDTCRAMLLVYDFGSKNFTKLDTGIGSCGVGTFNGLSSPSGLEFGVGSLVGVYAGDYQGNVWKFMLDTSTGAWKAPARFFVATSGTGTLQPITAPVALKRHPGGGVMVLFGTGKFFESGDRTDKTVQTIYGLRDLGQNFPNSNARSLLQAQTILTGTEITTTTYRTISYNNVDWSSKRGWYLDLTSTVNMNPSGERVVAAPAFNFDVALFDTYAPGANACTGAGVGFLQSLDTFAGGINPNVPLFDLNNDGKIDTLDLMGGNAPSGIKTAVGSLKSPSTMLVTTPPKGGDPSAPDTGCGKLGEPVCATGAPCNSGLTASGGICVNPMCKVGNIMVSSGGLPNCMSSEAVRYPRWIEIN